MEMFDLLFLALIIGGLTLAPLWFAIAYVIWRPRKRRSIKYHHDRKPVDPCWPEWKREIGEALQAARRIG